MFLKASLTVALALLPSVFGATIDPQTCVEELKYLGVYNHGQAGCRDLVNPCRDALKDANTTDIWSIPVCVAGITCDGANLLTLAQCDNPAVSVEGAPHLDYDIYASIVGDCAWAADGCPITFQNYVDFVYGQLSAVGSSQFPASTDFVRTYWWSVITDWTATGDSVPYTNFDDWLHYAADAYIG